MKKTTILILISALTALCGTSLSKADSSDDFRDAAEAAAKALLPHIEINAADKSAFHEYIRRIDETTWSEKKKDSSFLGTLNAMFSAVPVQLTVESKYSEFDEARRAYFEKIFYVADERESYLIFRQYLTDAQVTEYFNLLGHIYDRGGWRIYERSSTAQNIILEIVWLNPAGFSTIPDFTATVVGGQVPGAPEGQLFPLGYKLQNGSQSVTIVRAKGAEVDVNLNAAGRSITYTAPSDEDVALSTASPVGTIVASMLPPYRYTDVTEDKSHWFATKAKWVPADGRDVTGSKYSSLISSRVPDLRGQFLRGLNQFEPSISRNDGEQDPEGDGRQAGGYQGDEVGPHHHSFQVWNTDGGINNGPVQRAGPSHDTPTDSDTRDNGGKETHPKNIAIYYYIRINP